MTLRPIGLLVLAAELALLAIFAVNAPILGHQSPATPVTLLFLFGLPIVLIAGAIAILRMFRQRSLLRTGAYSIGRVTSRQKQFIGLGLKKVAISYEFPVGGHKPMAGRGIDWTGKTSVEKPLLVFYEASDISRYIALCSTFWQVRTKSGQAFHPE